MRQVVATALALLLALFLMPLLLVPQGEGELPAEQGGLPLDRTVVTPGPSLDSGRQVKVKLADGRVETMAMDDYLWRVVAAEMPAAFEPEALKAQAVAARTYTCAKMERTTSAHPEADVCTDVACCQACRTPEEAAASWGANARMYTDKIAAAVTDTDGLAVLYGGKPIQAVFFSSADGRTVDAVEVWGNAVPYLTGVDSPEGEEVPNYHSTVTLTAEACKAKLLAKYPGADLSGDPSGWFSNTVSNSAGGVESMKVGGVTVSGQALRTLFALRSTSFTVSAGAEGVTFAVTGYGHGVGMSQYGANALAREGKRCEEILKWYYTGVEVARYAP
nr:stage II sporulation protein D [uncultured Flavonifractor sp.]